MSIIRFRTQTTKTSIATNYANMLMSLTIPDVQHGVSYTDHRE